MIKILLFFVNFFILFSTNAFSKILFFYEKGTGVPLSRVEMNLGGKIFYSDKEGKIDFEIDKEEKSAEIFRKGFEKQTILITSSEEDQKFYLIPYVDSDDQILVLGERRNKVSQKRIDYEEASKIAPGGDPAQVVRLLPGVQVSGFGSSVVIRGSGPRDSLYYVDDLEVPFVFHPIGDISVIPREQIASVEFESGGFGPSDGNVTGGVITLETKKEIPKRPRTIALVNVPIYAGIYHERPLSDEESLTVSFRRSYLEPIIKFFLKSSEDEDVNSLSVSPFFEDAYVSYLKKTNSGYQKTSMIGAVNGFSAIFPGDFGSGEEGVFSLELKTYVYTLGHEILHRYDSKTKLMITPQFYTFGFDNDFLDNKINLKVYNFRVPAEWTLRLSEEEDFYFGVDPRWAKANIKIKARLSSFGEGADFEDGKDVDSQFSEVVQGVSSWAAFDYKIADTKITPGIRGTYNGQLKKTAFDPRLRMSHKLSEDKKLKAAFGYYSQDPEPGEASQINNPDLSFEKSTHAILGYEQSFGQNYMIDLQLFSKNITDVIVPDTEKVYANKGKIKSTGAEFFLRRNMTSRLFGWLSYTYSVTKEKLGRDETFYPSEYDQTHVLNLAGSYKLSSFWELGSRYNHHTGDTYTPIRRAIYNGNFDKYQPRQYSQDKNSKRLPPYHSLTVYFSRDVFYDTSKMQYKFGLESYWYKAPVQGVSYNYDYSQERKVSSVKSIPFIEARGEF